MLLTATRDHKTPKSRGGGSGDNIVLACQPCNTDKGDLTEEEYREYKKTGVRRKMLVCLPVPRKVRIKAEFAAKERAALLALNKAAEMQNADPFSSLTDREKESFWLARAIVEARRCTMQ